MAIFKRLAQDADIVVENYRPDVEAPARHRLREPAADQPAADLRQHLRLRPERAVSRPARRGPDRPGHGRADVDHRHPGAGAGAGRHPDRRSLLGHPARAGHPGGAASSARRTGRGEVGAHLAARGACSPCSTSRPRAGSMSGRSRRRPATTTRPASRPASSRPRTATSTSRRRGDELYERFCRAIERPDLRTDPRFATAKARSTNRDAPDGRSDAGHPAEGQRGTGSRS